MIVALTAGVALMVQTAGTIESNEKSIEGWLDHHYQADLFVTSGGPFSSSGTLTTMDQSFEVQAAPILPPGTKMVTSSFRYPNYDSPTIGETRILMTLLDARAHYAINKERGSRTPYLDLYRRLAEEPGGVLISENFSLMHKIDAGDELTLKGSEGPVKLKVLGIIEEYSWNRGSITLDLKQYRDIFRVRTTAQSRNLATAVVGLSSTGPLGALPPLAYGGGTVDAFEVYLPPGANVAQVHETLLRDLGPRHALVVLTRGELLDKIRDMLRRIYGVAYAQELLVGIVAVLGVVTALLISVLARRRELGLLRAVGGTRGQLLHTILAEAVLIGFVGTVLGVLVGIPFEHYVVRVVLFDETGYTFPVRIPWAATGFIAALAIFCSILAGIGPAIHAMRLKITEAIAYE